MKPFFNLGCALVAWNALAKLTQARYPTASAWQLSLQALVQGRHSHQFVYEKSRQALKNYHGLLLEPLLLLDQRPDGRWQWRATAADAPLNRQLRTLLQNQLPQLPLTLHQQPADGVARLRITVCSRHGQLGGQQVLPHERGDGAVSPLLGSIGAYLHHIASIVQLEDAQAGSLLGGSVNLQAKWPTACTAPGSWQDILGGDWLPLLLQAEPDSLAAS